MRSFRFFLILGLASLALKAQAACTGPAGVTGQFIYQSSDYIYCNNSIWRSLTNTVTGTACTTAGQITYSAPYLYFCNGSNLVQMNSIISSGASAAVNGTMRYNSSNLRLEGSRSGNWYILGPDPAPPSSINISHTPNNRKFTISWTAGIDNGNCSIQYRSGAGAWTNISSNIESCDSSISIQKSVTNASAFSGYNWDTTGTDIRILRISDSQVLATLSNALTCSVLPGSPTATNDIDEDCDKTFDQYKSQSVDSAAPAMGAAYTCATSYTNGTFTADFASVRFNKTTTTYSVNGCSGSTYSLNICSASLAPRTGTVPSTATHQNLDGYCDYSLAPAADASVTTCQSYGGSNTLKNSTTTWANQRCVFGGYF